MWSQTEKRVFWGCLLILQLLIIFLVYQEGREGILTECKTKTFFSMHHHIYECLPYEKGNP